MVAPAVRRRRSRRTGKLFVLIGIGVVVAALVAAVQMWPPS
jgi:hypothetical protein